MKNITAPAIIAKTEETLSRVGAPYVRSAVLAAIARLLRGETIVRDGYHPTALDIAVNVVMQLTYPSGYNLDGIEFRLSSADCAVAAELEAVV